MAPVQTTETCSFCHGTRHTVDKCWKKHGYPEWFKLKQAEKRNRKHAQASLADTPVCTVSHVAQVSPQEGTSGLALNSTASNTWVIDSGATDHFTPLLIH